QAPNEGGAGWVAILVEWMCLRRGLLHRGRAQTLLRRCWESWWARRLATSWRAELREIARLSPAPKTDPRPRLTSTERRHASRGQPHTPPPPRPSTRHPP